MMYVTLGHLKNKLEINKSKNYRLHRILGVDYSFHIN